MNPRSCRNSILWALLCGSFLVAEARAQQNSPADPGLQQPTHGPLKKRAVVPHYAGVYHPATGLRRSDLRASTASGPELIWNGLVRTNYYTYVGPYQEIIDEGTLTDRDPELREQVNGFRFVYCSEVPDPNGDLVTANIVFYDETAECSGPASWPQTSCGYRLSGLPGGDANGNLLCWEIDVDLQGGGFECDLTTDEHSNKLFGWGGWYEQDLTGPNLAQLGPGSRCSFTWFDRDPATFSGFLGCYWFQCQPPENFAMGLFGNPAGVFAVYGSEVGADDRLVLGAVQEAVAGSSLDLWVSDLDRIPVPAALWASPNRVDRDLQPILGLDAHEVAEFASRVAERAPAAFHSVVLPMGAAGRAWYCQAAQITAGQAVALSNGLEVWVR